MKRRNFLSLIGAVTLAPALPAIGAPGAVVAGYNRYMYGLAVFHACTSAGLNTAGLMSHLGVSSTQASAMMGEMTLRGVLSPLTGAVRATTSCKPYVRKVMRQLQDQLGAPDTPMQNTHHTDVKPASDNDPETGVS